MRTFDELQTAFEAASIDDDVAALREIADELSLIDGVEARAAEHSARGKAHMHTGEIDVSVDHFKKAVDFIRQQNDRNELALALLNLGYAIQKAGRAQDALRVFEEGLDVSREAGNDQVAAHMQGALGVTTMMLGDLDAAAGHITAELEYSETQNDQRGLLAALGNLGMIHWKQGDIPKAIEYLRRCLRVALERNDRFSVALVHQNLGAIYSSIGNNPESLVEMSKAEELYREIDHLDGIAEVQSSIGQLYIELGDLEKAEGILQKSLDRSRSMSNAWSQANDLDNLGVCCAEQGRIEDAVMYAAQAVQIFTELGMAPDVARVGSKLGMMYAHAGQMHNAREQYDRVKDIEVASPKDRLNLDELKAMVMIADNKGAEAEKLLLKSLDVAVELGLTETETQIRNLLRKTAYERKDLESYARYTDEYIAASEKIKSQGSLQRIAILEAERRATEDQDARVREREMLYKTLPSDIASRALRGEDVSGDTYHDAAVLFLDTVDFTKNSSALEPKQLTTFLGTIFRQLDKICSEQDVVKIKTIGDAYLAVAFTRDDSLGSVRLAATALEIINSTFTWPNGNPVEFRIGLHSGSLVAGVIGSDRLQYDVWGDTVNVASRMESTGEPGKVHCSESFADNVGSFALLRMTARGEINIKGKGTMTTYWLEGA